MRLWLISDINWLGSNFLLKSEEKMYQNYIHMLNYERVDTLVSKRESFST